MKENSYFDEKDLLTTTENYIRKRAKVKSYVYYVLVEFAPGGITPLEQNNHCQKLR